MDKEKRGIPTLVSLIYMCVFKPSAKIPRGFWEALGKERKSTKDWKKRWGRSDTKGLEEARREAGINEGRNYKRAGQSEARGWKTQGPERQKGWKGRNICIEKLL